MNDSGTCENRRPAFLHLSKGTTGALELLCLLAALFLMAACGGAALPTGGHRTITDVSVSCDPPSIQAGQTSQCTATVTETVIYSSGVNWSVNGVQGGNSTVGTISSSGLYAAPSSVPKWRNFTVATGMNGWISGKAITVNP